MDDRLIPSPCPLPMMCPAPFLKLLPPFPAFPCTLPMMYSSPPPFELSPGQDHRRPPTRRHTRAHQYGLGLNEERVVEEDETAGPERRPAGILAVGWLPRNVFHHVRPGHGALAPRHNFPPPQPVRVALANRKKRHRLASRAELHACMTGAGVRGLGFVQEETRTCARARARGWVARRRTKGGVEVASADQASTQTPGGPHLNRGVDGAKASINGESSFWTASIERYSPPSRAQDTKRRRAAPACPTSTSCPSRLANSHSVSRPWRHTCKKEGKFGLDFWLTPRGRGM